MFPSMTDSIDAAIVEMAGLALAIVVALVIGVLWGKSKRRKP